LEFWKAFIILGLALRERLLPLSVIAVFIAIVLSLFALLASNHTWKIGVILALNYLGRFGT
jgi:hypothetical protein